MKYVSQYYNTVGLQEPVAADYAVTGAAAGTLGALRQNLKSDSMSSGHSLLSMNPAFEDGSAAAGAAAALPVLTRTVSNASSEPRGPNPNAGWLNKEGLASNPLYQGERSLSRTTSAGSRRVKAPTDANALTGMTTQPNRVRGRVGTPDRSILDS